MVELSPSGIVRPFVTVISIMGIFIGLIAFMPSGFFVGEVPPEYKQIQYPDYWSADDIKNTQYWGNVTVIYDGSGWTPAYLTIVRGGTLADIFIQIDWWHPVSFEDCFTFWHYWYEWGWWKVSCEVSPYPITQAEVKANIDETGNASRFEMNCPHHNYITYFVNNGSHPSLTYALDNHENIVVSMGMGWDYESGALSGWDLVGRLLTFQLLEIHPMVNFLVAIPFWATVGVLTFIIIVMIVKSLPFT